MSDDNLYDIFDTICVALNDTVDATNCTVGIFDASMDKISYPFCMGPTGNVSSYYDRSGYIDTLARSVINSKGPVLVSRDEIARILMHGKNDFYESLPEQWLGLPLVFEDNVFGLVFFESMNNPEQYCENDKDIMMSVLDKSTLLIKCKITENELEKSKKINQTLFSISNALNSSGDFNEFYKSIHDSLNNIIDATNFFIAIYEHTSDVISFPYNVDIKDGELEAIEQASKSSSLTCEVIQKGESLFFNKKEIVERAGRMNLNVSGTPAEQWLGVPLLVKNKVVGALVVQSYDDPDVYNQKDMEFLVAVSDQVAMAINKKIDEEARKKSEILNKVLFSISNAVNTTENLEELYSSIYNALNLVKEFPDFFICIYDKDKNQVNFPFHKDEFDDYPKEKWVKLDGKSHRLTMDVIKNKSVLFLDEKQLLQRHLAQKASGTVAKVWIGVPLIIRDNVIGVMAVQHYKNPNYFTQDDIEMLSSVSDQISIAIDRKRSHENLNKKNKDLIAEQEKLQLALEKISGTNKELETAYHKIKSAQAQLLQAEKMQSVGRLAAGIAHEINTPIQFIIDNTHFIQESISDIERLMDTMDRVMKEVAQGQVSRVLAKEVKSEAEEIDLDYLRKEIPLAIKQSLEGLDRISQIVRAMKEFSHPGSDEKSSISLNEIIKSTTIVSRNEWKYNSDLEFDLDPNLPLVSCFAGEINQAILNMIVNAAHAIRQKFSEESELQGKIVISTKKEGDYAVIRINDNGGGIPEDIRSKIFDPFFTTKEVGEGTGQGLTISYSTIVDKHSGLLEVESDIGVGSTFAISLPLDEDG